MIRTIKLSSWNAFFSNKYEKEDKKNWRLQRILHFNVLIYEQNWTNTTKSLASWESVISSQFKSDLVVGNQEITQYRKGSARQSIAFFGGLEKAIGSCTGPST